MTSLLAIISAIVVIVAVVAYKLWSANREIERVLRVNADLEQTNQQQKAEIQTKKAEIKNAQIKQKNHDDVKRSNASNVDQQLQQHGWFRAEDSGHGLPSVQPDLPKPSRHGGDEASDSGSQSDSSGDM